MNKEQANAELLKCATDYPNHFTITSIQYNEAFISSATGLTGKEDTYFRVDVFYSSQLHDTIEKKLCTTHYQSVDEARKAIDQAFRDNQALKECLSAVEYEKLTDLGYEVK